MSAPARSPRIDRHGASAKTSREKTGQRSGKSRASDAERPASIADPVSASKEEVSDDGDDDGLFLGFGHRMSTDDRRRMRERESVGERGEEKSMPESAASRPTNRPASTYANRYSLSSSATSRLGSSNASESTSKPSTRSTAYSRQLEKRDRRTSTRSARTTEPSRSSMVSMPDDLTVQTAPVAGRIMDSLRATHGAQDSKTSSVSRYETASRGGSGHRRGREDADIGNISRSGGREHSPARESRKIREKPIQVEDRNLDRDERRRTRSNDRSASPSTHRTSRDEDRERRREERRKEREKDDYRRRTRSRDSTMSHSDENLQDARISSDRFDKTSREYDRNSRESRSVATTSDRVRLARDRTTRARSQEPEMKNRVAHRSSRRTENQEADNRNTNHETKSSRPREGHSERIRRSRSTDDPDSSKIAPTYYRRRIPLNDSKGSLTGGDRGQQSLPRSRHHTRGKSTDDGESSVSIYARRDRLGSTLDTDQPIIVPAISRSSRSLRSKDKGEQSGQRGSTGSDDSSDDSESEESISEVVDEPSSSDEIVENWTIRVCLISAVDLPFNIVPNIPLCPVFRFGLVKLPEDEAEQLAAEVSVETNSGIGQSRVLASKSSVSEKLEKSGILSFKRARVRCTSNKILSKRDNGAMEFHEEMRWDKIKRPNRTALAVELSARATVPPPNFNESPLAKEPSYVPSVALGIIAEPQLPASFNRDRWSSHVPEKKGSSVLDLEDLYQKALGKRATDSSFVSGEARKDFLAPRTQTTGGYDNANKLGINTFMNKYNVSQGASTEQPEVVENSSPPPEDEEPDGAPSAGIAGMRALWRKGRQQFEQRQKEKKKTTPNEIEAATAAAAVARFLVGGSNEGDSAKQMNGHAPEPASERQPVGLSLNERRRDPFAPSNNVLGLPGSILKRPLSQLPIETTLADDQNVALVRSRKRRKVEMGTDLRLGSLIIPLSRLPLEKATRSNNAARIEQWYQLDTTNNSLTPSQNPARRSLAGTSKLTTRRNPSVLLEISFSSPEVLDESEDELEEGSERDSVSGNHIGTGKDWNEGDASAVGSKSFSRRASMEMRIQHKATVTATPMIEEEIHKPEEKKKFDEDPVLEPGICDFIAVVGAASVGDQRGDDGSRGWINSNPECVILEQFPSSDEFHHKHKRNVTLNMKAEWFCFPEGCRVWRGTEPPSHMDLNLKRFSASSPPNIASSIAAFDACLNCTTSFSWFVIQSNEKENDFKNTKTYGAVIKFYAPAPVGIDATQDDYAQPTLSGHNDRLERRKGGTSSRNRLWVPLGILLTSTLPIVGHMEAMLLRLCESLASRTGGSLHCLSQQKIQRIIHEDIANLIINFQKPLPGVLHCSIPFLTGERLHITVPPTTALPQLPHGASVTSVCRLLGSEGLNVLLAAVLTECKILIHSDETANLPMVAEVVTALIYPFNWSLPYLPVLPEGMVEFVEAPLSYFIGVPTCHMKLIDDSVLTEIVVINLDNGFTSPDHYDGRRGSRQSKTPTPLPASVASSISKAVIRLLREEEEVDQEYGANNFPGSRALPRLEAESLAEREFRIAVALQICGLVRGYDDCLFKVSASQPVFNRDKFLRTAPALFEDRRGNAPNSGVASGSQRMLSQRSKRFLSLLVNCQHFHQFLESLDQEECAFFNEVMYTFDMHDDRSEDHGSNHLVGYGPSKLEDAVSHLTKALQKVEDKIPTYRVDRKGKKKKRGGGGGFESGDEDEGGIDDLIDGPDADDITFSDDGNLISSFTTTLLGQVMALTGPNAVSGQRRRKSIDDDTLSVESALSGEPRAVNTEMLQRLEKSAWEYNRLFDMAAPSDESSESASKPIVELREKVKLREAIGERRYRAWKVSQEQKLVTNDTTGRMFTADAASAEGNKLDLTTLLSQVGDDVSATTDASSISTQSITSRSQKVSSLSPEQQRVADAKDRDVLRRCLERAYEGGAQRRPTRFGRMPSITAQPTDPPADTFFHHGRDLIADAEAALRNPSAQKFLVSVLSQRSRLENQRKRRGGNDDSQGRRAPNQPTVSRLEPPAFDCLVRLCCAMLDACIETQNYESGYNLLTHTQGFCSVQTKDGKPLSKKDSEYDQGTKIVYMTAKIGLHPIFAELDLWEHVLQLHLKERENDKSTNPDDRDVDKSGKANSDIAAYETTVSTLYEMLGYGIPAEELSRFATQVSDKRGWFSTERGHSLLILARRLSVKRENGDDGTGNAGDLDMIRSATTVQSSQLGFVIDASATKDRGAQGIEDPSKFTWSEIGWCHPAALTANRPSLYSSEESGGAISSRLGSPSLLNMIGTDKQFAREEKKKLDESKYLKRSAVTSLASFGSSIVASGGLDGSVFVAHTILFSSEKKGKVKEDVVRGVRLDWGSSGSRSTVVGAGSSDGEYGVGAVSCLAAAKGAGYRSASLSIAGTLSSKDVVSSKPDDDDLLSAMEGCRVIAGTTGGDLRVWSVKDVYAATVVARKGSEALSSVVDVINPLNEMRISHVQDSSTSSYISQTNRGITEIAAGSAFSRLKFSLRGRALSGHRGGVTCIDVPSHIYRPDALVTGGADGFIKLWSLRTPTGRRTSGELLSGGSSTPLFNTSGLAGGATGSSSDPMGSNGRKGGRGGDALSILSGHTGRVLCVKTAWHGDRLLSGGADRTVRIWDLAGPGGGGKCLHALTGHLGWVTHTHYWGPNTIVSASTDRAIALWDARVRISPLFVLRYHQSPISDLLVGSRTDPLMVSAAADGTVATWDFRMLSGGDTENGSSSGLKPEKMSVKKDSKLEEKHCKSIRDPPATMLHASRGSSSKQAGAVLLSRGAGKVRRTVITVGSDAVAREWDISTGQSIREESTGHCDVVSSLLTFSDGTMGASSGVEPSDVNLNFGGTISSSWDGTIRMKKLVRR